MNKTGVFKLRVQRFIENIPDASAISVATKTTLSGGAAGLYSWISGVNWVGAISILVAVIGLGANLYFQRRRDKREQEEHRVRLIERELMLDKLRGGCE